MGRPFIDHTGERYSYLTIIGYAGQDPRSNNARLWRCLCDCGKETVVRWNHLAHGHTNSCGCRKGPGPRKGLGSARVSLRAATERHKRFRQYQHGATARGYEFQLSEEEFLKLIEGHCHYCGAAPRQSRTAHLVANGIDRIDNTKGYVPGNVRSCCTMCNRAKGTLTEAGFLSWIRALAAHYADPKKAIDSNNLVA